MPRDPERRRTYQRGWYSRNRQVFLDKNEARKRANQKMLLTYLEDHPCVDCGEDDRIVLEFDHLDEKSAEVTRLVRSGYSWKRILDEIAKCEVVCANCHKRRTYTRCGSYRVAK